VFHGPEPFNGFHRNANRSLDRVLSDSYFAPSDDLLHNGDDLYYQNNVYQSDRRNAGFSNSYEQENVYNENEFFDEGDFTTNFQSSAGPVEFMNGDARVHNSFSEESSFDSSSFRAANNQSGNLAPDDSADTSVDTSSTLFVE